MKIRTKLIRNFFALIIPFIAIFGAITIHEINSAIKNINRLDLASKDIHLIYELQVALDRAIMSGNDYIITGDRKYIDDFHRVSGDVERILKDAEEIDRMRGYDTIYKKEKSEILKEIRFSWQNIKEISLRIFTITNPVRNKRASALIEEMDYKWKYPLNEKFDRLMAIYMKGYRDAFSQHHSAMRLGFITFAIATAVLLIGGVSITLLYSLRLNKILMTIHKGAEKIAGGDFKTRLDIKTGDEFEWISNAMNDMASRLDSLYSNLEKMVEERTRELKESEERYRGIFEKTPNAMVVFDSETWRFENVNRAAIDLYGYTEAEFLSLTPMDVSAEVEKTKIAVQNGLAEKVTHISIRYHKKKDGTVFPIEIFMGTFSSGGRNKGFAVIVDLTEVKKAEEMLKQRIDELEQFRKVTIKRELRMEELKKRVEELERKLGVGSGE